MFLAVRGGARCLHHHRDLQLCGEHTHGILLHWALISRLWQSQGGGGLQVASTMIDTHNEPVLGLSAVWLGCSVKMLWLAPSIPRMCFDWLRYKNPTSQVETECRVCSNWGILQNIHLDKRGDFIVPSSLHDQLHLASHKCSSVAVCVSGKYYNRSVLIKVLTAPFHNWLHNRQPLINTAPWWQWVWGANAETQLLSNLFIRKKTAPLHLPP